MLDSEEPATSYEQRAGRWVGEDDVAAGDRDDAGLTLHFGPHSLGSTPGPRAGQPMTHSSLRGVEASGLAAGTWCPHAGKAALPGDQRRDDALALASTLQPLDEPLEILGFPTLELELAADSPCALLAVRLCDVNPDGRGQPWSRAAF